MPNAISAMPAIDGYRPLFVFMQAALAKTLFGPGVSLNGSSATGSTQDRNA